jgi:RimJ/RimL family protein N-acetyltransferase
MTNTRNLKDGRTCIIRNAIPKDASGLIDYLNTIAAESDNLTFGLGEWDVTIEAETEFIESAMKSDNQYFVIAELEGLIIANLNFTAGTRPRLEHFGEFGVSVLKEYWGNGIAFELIDGLIQWAKNSKKITKINLQVREDNERAIKLYKKFGFEIEGLVTRTFFIEGEYYNSYQMGKLID